MRGFTQKPKAGSQNGFVDLVIGIAAWRLNQVAGQVLDQKIIVRNIGIEGANQVIAIPPGIGQFVIEFVATSFRVANQVHPVSRPSFAVAWRGQ